MSSMIRCRNLTSCYLTDDASDIDIRRACYQAFLADVEPKAEVILTKYSMLRQLQGVKKQTNAERKACFRKFCKKIQDQVSSDARDSLRRLLTSSTIHRSTHMRLCMDSILCLFAREASRTQTADLGLYMSRSKPRVYVIHLPSLSLILINQDLKFFESRCRANLNTILSHLKAHVL